MDNLEKMKQEKQYEEYVTQKTPNIMYGQTC